MNCDRIAPFYQWIERAAFGGRLQRHRVAFQNAVTKGCRVLVVGDGDGRFTHSLVQAFPDAEIDFIDMSAGMIKQARKRIGDHSRVRIFQQDVTGITLPSSRYDVLFTHFFLDCFTTETLQTVVSQLSNSLQSESIWIVSDFRELSHGWRKFFSQACLSTMYLFFRLAAGLRTRQLPAYSEVIQKAGFSLRKEQVSLAGLIASEWWQR